MKWLISLLSVSFLYGAEVSDKILILGVCKNVEASLPIAKASAEALGQKFLDYRVMIYENNSTDRTSQLLYKWVRENPRVVFVSENLSSHKLAKKSHMKVVNRTETLAFARNKVLAFAMKEQFDDYKYVLWADLDFLEMWDVDNIIDTILNEEHEWDAVFGNGAYDQFAFRDPEFPIGFELLGNFYWEHLDEMRAQFSLEPTDPWRKVYSAFGGIGLYKREALKGCFYSGVVTKDLEKVTAMWLEDAYKRENVPLLNYYTELMRDAPTWDLRKKRIKNRQNYPDCMGLRLHNKFGEGEVTWFSCTKDATLPWTCEHIPLHASMILKGHDKLYVNPRIISRHP